MSSAAAIGTILASAVIVLTGLIALTRAVFRAAVDLRDNKHATQANTQALAGLASQMDGRLSAIESRLATLESSRPRS